MTSRLSQLRVGLLIAVATSAISGDGYAAPVSPAAGVPARLSELKKFIGSGATGQGWRQYLLLESLEAQVQPGAKPDPMVLEQVVARLSGSAAGLNLAPFVNLRLALEARLAKLPPPPKAQLAELAKAHRQTYRPRSAADIAAARKDLAQASAQLSRYLQGGKYGAAWREFLKMDDLQTQLQSATPDLEILQTVESQFYSDKDGLELPVFARVARALKVYDDRLETVDSPEMLEYYQQQIDVLAAALETGSTTLEPETRAAIEWLAQADQAAYLRRSINYYYSYPNLYVGVSRDLLISAVQRPVNDTSPLRDFILGTRIVGTGHTLGNIGLHLTPDPQRAVLDIRFTGNVRSNTTGYNGPAVVTTLGSTTFQASKRLVLNHSGLQPQPASASARLSTRTTGLCLNINIPIIKGIITQFAWKQVAKKKGQSEQVGARRAERRIAQRLNEEIDSKLADVRKHFDRYVVNPILRRGESPSNLKFSTTADGLSLVAKQVGQGQLGATTAPPQPAKPVAILVRLHESYVNNLGQSLAGRTQHAEESRKRREEIAKALGRTPPAEPMDEDEEEKGVGTITFADEQPLTMKVDDQTVTITIRAKGFTRGEKVYEGMIIAAIYKIEQTPTGVRAVRQGRLQIYPPGFVPGEEKLPLGKTVLVNLLRKSFDKIFKEEIVPEAIVFKGEASGIGKLVTTQVTADAGWLLIGVTRVPPERLVLKPAAPRILGVAARPATAK